MKKIKVGDEVKFTTPKSVNIYYTTPDHLIKHGIAATKPKYTAYVRAIENGKYYVAFEDAKNNITQLGYSLEHIILVKGTNYTFWATLSLIGMVLGVILTWKNIRPRVTQIFNKVKQAIKGVTK